MKIYGNTQRRYGTERPQTFDRATRKVCVDIQTCEYEEPSQEADGGTETVQGYSWIEVYLGSGGMDYPSVKSKLIEAAYPPKDEFGFLMNAVSALVNGDTESEDLEKFKDMDTWRSLCAKTAKEVCREVGTVV